MAAIGALNAWPDLIEQDLGIRAEMAEFCSRSTRQAINCNFESGTNIYIMYIRNYK